MIKHVRPQCWLDRVVDSDTLVLWIEATPDVRIRYRTRLVGVEGGELGTEEGAAGTALLADVLADMSKSALYWQGSFLTRDQHGRLVGDVVSEQGERLTSMLLAAGRHWRRNKSGQQFRS